MKKLIISLSIIIATLIIIPIIASSFLFFSSDLLEPEITINKENYTTSNSNDTTFCIDSYLLQDSSKLWELYLRGSNQERGAKQGALTKDLMRYQEDVFMKQITNIIPSEKYLWFLHKLIIIFNRNIGEHIPLEYRNEIAAMSQFCTKKYNAIGTPYERQLNYHAAHDIGHTMQQYMLVGCSSFATWNNKSQDNKLIVGRNFDFYVGDDFAKNKLITLVAPDKGYKYISISWAGMVGVLSGMNETGLTVTINAAKGAIPTAAATPISILTREILQYASNIDQAYEIAKKYKTFVSESILIASANDNKAAIIEKTPEKIALYQNTKSHIVCTNHFQAEEFKNDNYNIQNIKYSDSKYRYNRLEELLQQTEKINHTNAIDILRNQKGLNNSNVGLANEMTLNQSIAHHAVVFNPSDSLVWISTSPWQSGEFVCYNLKNFFKNGNYPSKDKNLYVQKDSAFINNHYNHIIEYRKHIKEIKNTISNNNTLSDSYINKFININPNHYYTYRIIGDYYNNIKDYSNAKHYYNIALKHQIPYLSEREEIEKLALNEK